MKFDNKTFLQKYEAWKNGADYWKDIRGINLGGNTQAEEPSDEERLNVDREVLSILNAYNCGKDENDLQNYRGGKDDPINTFVSRMGPLVGQLLNRYGYGDTAYYNVMRQLAYESNYGRSRVARQQHNYGGVGFNGKTYTSYKNDEDFVKNYVRLMHNKYDSALRAKSTLDYARALKQRGYYKDSLENYSRNLRGMDSLVKAAYNHRIRHRDAYNYNVSLKDLVLDYEDVKNSSPIVLNSMSVEQPSTIRADVPKTLIGPTREEVKALLQKMLDEYRQKMYNQLTSTRLPNILNLLPLNNFGKDSYGLKFWWRRGNNLHFNGGKDKRSFSDWVNKASEYKGIKIKYDPTYDYKGWYNEDPNRAYALLNDDPNAHFDDKWKTPYHPTFSDLSVYSNAKHPGGTWGRFDYRDAYYSPLFSYVNPNDRIAYLNMAEENGVIPFMNNGSMYRLDGDLYGGVLPAVQVIGKRGNNLHFKCGKDNLPKFTDGDDGNTFGGNIAKALGAGEIGQEIANFGTLMIPVVGTYYDWKTAVNDPTIRNIGTALMTTAGDVFTLGAGGMAIRAGLRATKAAANYKKAIATYNTAKTLVPGTKLVTRAIRVAGNAADEARIAALRHKAIKNIKNSTKALVATHLTDAKDLYERVKKHYNKK